MSDHTTNEPTIKLCECGCGQPTKIATKTYAKRGQVKGQPMRFLPNHKAARSRPEVERFWEKVDKRGPDECWQWKAGKTIFGYGVFHAEISNTDLAHRFSYALHYGTMPDGVFVCHRCDNPACVNPAHLFLGTPLENSQDMVKKNRHWVPTRKGDANGRAKLTEDDVREIRRLRSNGVREIDVAQQFRVSVDTVSSIFGRRTWSHIP